MSRASLARLQGQSIPSWTPAARRRAIPEYLAAHAPWIKALARDLTANRGKSLVIAGESQPAEVHTVAHLINHSLGNIGKTVEFFPRADAGPSDQLGSLKELVRDIASGAVETLIILGGNPAFDAPADLDFARTLASDKTKLRIHLGLYDDETARLCHWHIPQAHFLESWSDLKAYDGTATIQQPLIAPLYKGRSAHELLALLLGQPDLTPLEIVRDYWKRQGLPGDFEIAWRDALESGVVKGTAAKPKAVVPQIKELDAALPRADGSNSLEIVFRPDPTIWDGRYANNGWLQELPKPLTKLSWDSAALLSPATASRLDIENEDVLELSFRGRVGADSGLDHAGPGRPIGDGVPGARPPAGGKGRDVRRRRRLRSAHGRMRPGLATGLEIRKTGERRRLAAMHHHFSMEGRDLIGRHARRFPARPGFACDRWRTLARRRRA